jgi:ABC-2 type transport system ATP-binding protein
MDSYQNHDGLRFASVIQVKGLVKKFGSLTAVDGLFFEAREGEILGLLGPNGAGKTTILHLLLGLITPSAGEIRILGHDPRSQIRAILQRINFCSAETALPSNLTVWENLNVFAKLYGLRSPRCKIEQLLELFEIPEVLRRKTGALSSGQKTRLNLCKAFLNDPEILFLDEPTSSLDPHIAAKVRSTLRRVQADRRVTMIYTSHDMREVERMCDRIIFISRGRIVAQGTPEEVMRRTSSPSLEDVFINIARDHSLEGRERAPG